MTENEITGLQQQAVQLLKELIRIPSFSREEDQTASLLEKFLAERNIAARRYLNNVWAVNKLFDPAKPSLLLNSHHDTVKPNAGYTLDPFEPIEKEGRLFGLGSNDAGGPLVSLLATFLFFYEQELPFNIVFAATAEEEVSGKNGVEILLPLLPSFAAAIVGEPTQMKMAIAEKGLLVLDGKATGKAGHAARNEGINALYIALKDIEGIREYAFEKVSPLLGPVHVAVTSIHTPNTAHNIVPSECSFIVDVRVNELYSFEEVLRLLQQHSVSILTPRSTRLKPSFLSPKHPLAEAGSLLGLVSYGSPTCSDMALMDFPSLKLGPGDSARSHTADEFIYINEIEDGISTYIALIQQYASLLKN